MTNHAQRNVVVLGCGRSGTSMLAGLFRSAGYSMGRGLFAANVGNPKGLFESREVNRINESILAAWAPAAATTTRWSAWANRLLPRYSAWLAAIPTRAEICATHAVNRRIRRAVEQEPYCFKDPRFSYTLDLWRPHLRDPLFVCVFREPERTAVSIVREASRRRYLRDLDIDRDAALDVWSSMYRWILERHAHSGRWLFVHAEQVLEGHVIGILEQETGARLDHDFADPELQSRSDPSEALRPSEQPVDGLYRELCKRADWDPTRRSH